VSQLADLYPDSVHVFTVGLSAALDSEIWEYARANDLIIVTKDADFSELGLLRGFPPKVIWIRRGNCSTAEIEELLRENHEAIRALGDDPIYRHTRAVLVVQLVAADVAAQLI
jgi:predicted nuclease of predicted toxin-antitoxin system